MVSSMSLSEVVSSQGRFIAAQPATGVGQREINPDGGSGRARTAPPARRTVSETLSHAAAQPQARRPAPGQARPVGRTGGREAGWGPPTRETEKSLGRRCRDPRREVTRLPALGGDEGVTLGLYPRPIPRGPAVATSRERGEWASGGRSRGAGGRRHFARCPLWSVAGPGGRGDTQHSGAGGSARCWRRIQRQPYFPPCRQ